MTHDRRLLLVEDDEPTQHLIRVLMELVGLETVCASDGAAALQELRRGDFEVVLLDLLLPGLNGFEVLRELKCLRPELMQAVIVITAASSLATRDCEELRSVWRVMQKPLDIEELLAEIRACAFAGDVSAARKPPHAAVFRPRLRNAG